MIAYRGEFAIRDGGKDRQARIVLTAQGEGDTPSFSPLVFGSSPVVLTWEECALTDVIHRSQLQLNLIAIDDGDYRDIMDSLEQVYCMLQIKDDDDLWRLWWVGAYASTTWLEPFSRERKYEVQLTFSDFGYLERLDYDGNRFDCPGAVTVSAILSWVAYRIAGYAAVPDVKWMPLSAVQFNMCDFSRLIVRDVLFTEDDGSSRNVLDILTDVLEPANVHVMQHCGRIYLFRPDWETAEEAYHPGAVVIESAGIDAEMESCETYRRMELNYDPRSRKEEGFSVDMTGFRPVSIVRFNRSSHVIEVYADNGDDECRAIISTGNALHPIVLLWMCSDKQEYFQYVYGGRPSAVAWTPSPSGITYQADTVKIYGSYQIGNVFIQDASVTVSLTIWAAIDRYVASILTTVGVKYRLSFVSVTGTVKYYRYAGKNSTAPSWEDTDTTDDGLIPLLRWVGENGEDEAILKLSPVDRNGREDIIYSLDDTGEYLLDIDMSSIYFRDGSSVSPVVMVGLSEVVMELSVPESTDMIDLSDEIKQDLVPVASGLYSKTFRMGTLRSMATPDAIYSFVTGSGEIIADDGRTMIDSFRDFIKDNYTFPVRRRVRGSYFYPHMAAAFPVFLANRSVPLYTLQRDDRVFFLMSEQWDLKTGISQLVLEEAYARLPDFCIVTPQSLGIGSGGTGILEIKSNTSWTVTAGAGLSASPLSASGDATLTVSADINSTGGYIGSYIEIAYGEGKTERVDIRIAPEAYKFAISEASITTEWFAASASIGIETNAPEDDISFVFNTTPSGLITKLNLLKDASGSVVKADLILDNTHKGGRMELALGAIIKGTATAGDMQTSDFCLLSVPAPGNMLNIDDECEIPAEGGQVSIQIMTNAKWVSFGHDIEAFPADTCSMYVYWINPETGEREMLEGDFVNMGIANAQPAGDPGQSTAYIMELYISWSDKTLPLDSTFSITGGYDGDARVEKFVRIYKAAQDILSK